jgi:hypothetical protein
VAGERTGARDPSSDRHGAWLEWVFRETFGGRERLTEGRDNDPIERWGRFLGRALGLIFMVFLIANLAFHWLF